MKNQNGFSSMATISVLTALLLLSLVFGFWAFSGRQDFKNNSDKKAAAAATSAKTQQATIDKASYDAIAKQPYKSFLGSAIYGTVAFSYPKTWSAYVDQTSQTEPINAYFNPGEVPGIATGVVYSLRVELTDSDYTQIVDQFSSQVSSGQVKSSAYIPPKMVGVKNVQPGTLFAGGLWQNGDSVQQGSMLVIKVRDKTLQIYTQSADFASDFSPVVLSSLTFVP